MGIRRTPLLLALIAISWKGIQGCQETHIVSVNEELCKESGKQLNCAIQQKKALHLNSIRHSSCLRIKRQDRIIDEIQIELKALSLLCEKDVEYYTRESKAQVQSTRLLERPNGQNEYDCNATLAEERE